MPDAQPELSGAPLALGIYGKMPAHGDFVRRGLPSSFVTPWDAWLSAGVAAARDQLAAGFEAVWDAAPAWRFSLPAGVCGPDAVAGVMLPSEDTVGRRFPLTAAALLPAGVIPEEAWFARLEAAVRAARQGAIDADGMIRAMQSTPEPEPEPEAAPGDVLGMLGGGMAGMALGGARVSAAETPAAQDPGQWRAATDPMEGPADAEPPAPASDMWGALLGEPATDATPAIDAMEGPAPDAAVGDWGALLGDGPISGPGAAPAPAEAAVGGGGDIWGDLLGDAAKDAAQATPDPAAEGHWDDLIGEALAAPPGAAMASGGAGDDAASRDGPPIGAQEDDPAPAALAPVAATEPIVAPGPAASGEGAIFPGADAPAPDALPRNAPPLDAARLNAPPLDAPPLDTPPLHAPVRPPDGGWWTLGGTRLAPMVWPLPELPPAESFILLLHHQDPESGA